MRQVWRGMLGRGRRRWRRSKEHRLTKVCATGFCTLLFLEKCGRVVVTSKWCLRQGAKPSWS